MFSQMAIGIAALTVTAGAVATISLTTDAPLDERLPLPLANSDFLQFDQAQVELGQLLFYDKVLSGNLNISCGTCHHHDFGSSDGLSLGIGEGGAGVGPTRAAMDGAHRIMERIPRNSPALWNLGARDLKTLFHDGRLQMSDAYGNGFDSPVDEYLPDGLNSLLAAQSLFPITSHSEMAGDPGENPVADAVAEMPHLAWPLIEERVQWLPGYLPLFQKAFPHVNTAEDISIVEIGNALAAFIGTEWKNHDSPFDRYLEGDQLAMSVLAVEGMELFYGDAGCASCHSGALLSDQSFHAIGLPEFGPGKTEDHTDPGRFAETGDEDDLFRFRTPMLRNVALTAPYGHNGAYQTLDGIIRHHADPKEALAQWTLRDAALPTAPWIDDNARVTSDAERIEAIKDAIGIDPVQLTDREVKQLVAFLESLTGTTADARPMGPPTTVPSGLSVD